MKHDVVELLSSLGYACQEDDGWMIDFSIKKVETYIKTACNTTAVPVELASVVVERVCGEFLQMKKASGQLDDTFGCGEGVSSVQAGDTNVTFDTTQSTGQQLDSLIASLLCSGEGEFVCYRRLCW